MEIAISIVLFLHLIGMAGLVGGALAQVRAKDRTVSRIMRDGALTQLVTGVILVGLVQANHEDLRMSIVGTKLVILVVILGLMYAGRKSLSTGYYVAILALSVLNVALALLVTSAA
jgi:hypothetical protein